MGVGSGQSMSSKLNVVEVDGFEILRVRLEVQSFEVGHLRARAARSMRAASAGGRSEQADCALSSASGSSWNEKIMAHCLDDQGPPAGPLATS